MPHVTIRLQVDPVTRKKNVVVSYESDSGALPLEHEDEHRRLVDKLIEGGALKAQELGKIIVERPQEEAPGESPSQAEPQREGLKSKS